MEKNNLLNMRKLSLTMAQLMLQIYYLACMKKLHAASAARRGCTHVMVCTVDTAVFSHRIAKFQYIFLSKLWVEFGVGKYLKYSCQGTICSVVLVKKSHKVFSHFTPSQAVIKHCLWPTLTKRQHRKRGVQWMV